MRGSARVRMQNGSGAVSKYDEASLFLPIHDHNPRSRFPVATLILVIANALVLVASALFLSPEARAELLHRGGAIPLEITTLHDLAPRDLVPPPLTIFTAMFLHAGFLHLLGNMWFLWIFGDNVEDRMGRLKFLGFYLVTGCIGAVAQSLLMPGSTGYMVGASGAVAGVLGGYFLLFPRARVSTLLLVFRVSIPAWVFLGVWFAGQLFLGSASGAGWMAHVGGFLAGLGLVRVFAMPRARALELESLPPPWGE
jgi:membrane associated rhomboid family serine protease